jgi:hypothetical protein
MLVVIAKNPRKKTFRKKDAAACGLREATVRVLVAGGERVSTRRV